MKCSPWEYFKSWAATHTCNIVFSILYFGLSLLYLLIVLPTVVPPIAKAAIIFGAVVGFFFGNYIISTYFPDGIFCSGSCSDSHSIESSSSDTSIISFTNLTVDDQPTPEFPRNPRPRSNETVVVFTVPVGEEEPPPYCPPPSYNEINCATTSQC